MAEIIGVVASGISIGTLSGQITSSILKLKSYWDAIHDAPSDILFLLEEIEDLQIVLSSIEDDQSRNSCSSLRLDGSSASRCLEHCQLGVQRLKDVVDDMAREMASAKKMKRRYGAAKMLFRKERIERYRAQLASAVRLLNLAHQVYTRSLIQLQPDIFALKVSQLMAPQNPETDNQKKEQQLSQGYKSEISRRNTETSSGTTDWIRHRSASRLGGLAWNIALSKSACGWKFSVSLQPAVPDDSLVVQYTKDGNVEKLKEIFSSRLASPFCITHRRGKSLLELAIENGRYETCRFLVEQGVKPSLRFDDVTFSGFLIVNASHREPISSPQEYAKIVDMMALQLSFTLDQLFEFRGSLTVFSTFLRWTGVSLQNLPLSKRCSFATILSTNNLITSPCPFIFRQSLQCNPTNLLAATWRHESGYSLLHVVAQAIGDLYTYDVFRGRKCMRSEVSSNILFSFKPAPHDLLEWSIILKELIDANADLHAQGSFPSVQNWMVDRDAKQNLIVFTPLLSMIYGFLNSFNHRFYPFDWSSKYLILWLRALQSLGVNLTAYGVEEARLWAQREVAWEFMVRKQQVNNRGYCEGNWYFISIIGFEYGPNPEDWKLWLDEPTDKFAGEFWRMTEIPQVIMPGSWVD